MQGPPSPCGLRHRVDSTRTCLGPSHSASAACLPGEGPAGGGVTLINKGGNETRADWLEQFFEERRPRLRAVAFRMLGSSADADDAVQRRPPSAHTDRG
jgi:hypothetical protein